MLFVSILYRIIFQNCNNLNKQDLTNSITIRKLFILFSQHLTAGINCDKCIPNYYRPNGIPANARNPCIPCECDSVGSDGPCNPIGGQCKCHKGYAGNKCTECATGFKGKHCTKCACDIRGTMEGGECESHCQCKVIQFQIFFISLYVKTFSFYFSVTC